LPLRVFRAFAGVFLYATIVRTKVTPVNRNSLEFHRFCPYNSKMQENADKRMGRPPKSGDAPMGERLEIRLETGEKAAYDAAAQAKGVDRSDWIRSTLNDAAKRILRKK
jgi:hypothetical protein